MENVEGLAIKLTSQDSSERVKAVERLLAMAKAGIDISHAEPKLKYALCDGWTRPEAVEAIVTNHLNNERMEILADMLRKGDTVQRADAVMAIRDYSNRCDSLQKLERIRTAVVSGLGGRDRGLTATIDKAIENITSGLKAARKDFVGLLNGRTGGNLVALPRRAEPRQLRTASG